MPRTILILLGFFFAVSVLIQTSLALDSVGYPVPILLRDFSRGASLRFALDPIIGLASSDRSLLGCFVPLAAINLMGVALSYALICDRRWRAKWRAYQSVSPDLLIRVSKQESLLQPNEFIAAIPDEPSNVYLEQPLAVMQWDKTRQGSEWLNHPHAEKLLAVCALKLLTEMELRGAYIGKTFHDSDRVVTTFDATPVRALRTRSRGTLPVYTFRLDRGRQHMVVTFVVRNDGNTFTLGWHQATLRATWFDTLRYCETLVYGGLLCVTVLPILLPLPLIYAFVRFPPSRGWTSLVVKISRDRSLGRFNCTGESWAEQMERDAFAQNVGAAFAKLADIKLRFH